MIEPIQRAFEKLELYRRLNKNNIKIKLLDIKLVNFLEGNEA